MSVETRERRKEGGRVGRRDVIPRLTEAGGGVGATIRRRM